MDNVNIQVMVDINKHMDILLIPNSPLTSISKSVFESEKEQGKLSIEDVSVSNHSSSPRQELESEMNDSQLNGAVIDVMCDFF